MQNLKHVKEFIFNRARYLVGDGNGGSVYLDIDYQEKKFLVGENGGNMDKDLLVEAEKIARNLISRKHGVNFAKKIRV
jgi:hypothetical protein